MTGKAKRGREPVVARLEIGGNRFEVLVEPELAFQVKQGKEVDPDELLISEDVYTDVRRGLRASPELLKKAFGTADVKRIAIEIIRRNNS